MSPNQTTALEPTEAVLLLDVSSSSFTKFQIWDFPGLFEFSDESMQYFKDCSAIVYVLDAQDEYIDQWMENLQSVVQKALQVRDKIELNIFIHKADQIPAASLSACKDDVSQRILRGLRECSPLADDDEDDYEFPSRAADPSTYSGMGTESTTMGAAPSTSTHPVVHVAPTRGGQPPADNLLDRVMPHFYVTSIYDHSIFQALSDVARRLVPQQALLEHMVTGFAEHCELPTVYLFDVMTKMLLASCIRGPVDVPDPSRDSFGICSDAIDFVIDVSFVYSQQSTPGGAKDPHDSNQSCLIKLSDGYVLSVRKVDKFLALVALGKRAQFEKHGLIAYNFETLRKAVLELEQTPGAPTLSAQALSALAERVIRTMPLVPAPLPPPPRPQQQEVAPTGAIYSSAPLPDQAGKGETSDASHRHSSHRHHHRTATSSHHHSHSRSHRRSSGSPKGEDAAALVGTVPDLGASYLATPGTAFPPAMSVPASVGFLGTSVLPSAGTLTSSVEGTLAPGVRKTEAAPLPSLSSAVSIPTTTRR
ncbi:putative Ras-related GTP-binding protein D [Paratrimastix pyriformis]|uniref:Ras-related GTP-binding protein D n=1 Tax=Paratrimastix pyriformis TaxID=342808 RepID=A0ABQ8UUS5_9EUKA|nr:putative Ras-related GTP-binding protein D [Paratrimastix pyriformis]